jgi:hypothetical protein
MERMRAKFALLPLFIVLASLALGAADRFEYKLLATNRTGTMEKEMNQAADAGYSFDKVMGGETGFGGKEVVVIMTRGSSGTSEVKSRKKYKLLATNRTATMQKELQQVGDQGYEYKGQTVFETAFGGKEVVVIVERDTEAQAKRIAYKLLATNLTSTMEKELREAGEAGFQLVGMSVSKTAFGGSEVVSILRKTD